MPDLVWTNTTVKLGQLKPWAHNPRFSTKAQAKRLLASWKELGQFQTVAIGPECEVYDGHQRLSALLTVYGPDYAIDARQSNRALSDEERQKLVITAHVGAVGSWDWQKISGWEAAKLQEWGMDADTLKAWNTDATNLKEMLKAEAGGDGDAEPQTDRAAELLEKWQVKAGDLWRIGEHRLLCGDSTDKEQVERLMGDDKADLVLTDPPYSVDYAAKNRALQTIGRSNRLTTDIEGDTLSTEETAESIWGPAFENAYSVSRNGTVIYCFSPQGGDQMMMMMMMLMKAKWNERLHQLIWRKNAPTFSMGRLDYQYQHEPILYSWRGTNHGYYGEIGRSVIDCDRPSSSKLHPTMKPVELFEIFVGNSSQKGEVVLEPFGGSGTTMVACQNLGRRARLTELAPSYCAVILERMATAFPELVIEKL